MRSDRALQLHKRISFTGRRIWTASRIVSLALLLSFAVFGCSSTLSATQLRITDPDQANPAALSRYRNLELLDLRDAVVTEGQVNELSSALPDCAILWLVPIGGERIDNSVSAVTLPADANAEDMMRLRYFDRLESVDASACAVSRRLLEAADAFPEISFQWSIYGIPVNGETTRLDLSGQTIGDPEALLQLLSRYPAIAEVDLTDAEIDADSLRMLSADLERVTFVRDISLFGRSVSVWSESLDLTSETEMDCNVLQDSLRQFPNLVSVDISGYTASFDEMDALKHAFPAIRFRFRFQAFDQSLTSDAETLDLSCTAFSSEQEVVAPLAYLPALREVNLCDSGLTNEQMERLVAAYPEIKFVWYIRIGGWKMRTDTTVFSKGQRKKFPNGMGEFLGDGKTNFTSEDLEPLKYCKDLIFLDLGHGSKITDLSILYHFTHLRGLVLSMNKITDITPISSLQELESLEIYQNYITDVSPLAALPNLKYVNMSVNSITDVTPLMGMKQLKMLWLVRNQIPEDAREALAAALPECEICFWSWGSGTGGWRENEVYLEYQKAFQLPTLP